MASSAIRHSLHFDLASRRRFGPVACLIASDVAALGLAVTASLGTKWALQGVPDWTPYFRLWPFLFVFVTAYALAGLYSGLALSPPQELRRATLTSTVIFLILAAATVTLRGATHSVTWTLLMAMTLTIVFLPIFRGGFRQRFAQETWWGHPAIIFGAGSAGRAVLTTLLDQPGLGLRPTAIVTDEWIPEYEIEGVPVINTDALARLASDFGDAAYAVVAGPDVRDPNFLDMIERRGVRFARILMIPSIADFCSLWVDTRNVGGLLALEVFQQAFVRQRQLPKRILDVVLTAVGGLLILPLMLLVAAWVWIDSPGPLLYSQNRIGQDGKEFRAWKFRTMVPNADQMLDSYLEANPDAREEWAKDHKLRHDPRITKVGHFLRRTSLDELPQLWNVLRGEMSLVGPRPIVRAEVEKYGERFGLYTEVKSGLTGLWQISGRNDTTYLERVRLDSYYVRNWSVWLDFYILFRTIDTVLFRKGAY